MVLQVAVIDCLDDPDDTLKLKTLELLATMTKSNNVEVREAGCLFCCRTCPHFWLHANVDLYACRKADRVAAVCFSITWQLLSWVLSEH
jgi:hypothetical protein